MLEHFSLTRFSYVATCFDILHRGEDLRVLTRSEPVEVEALDM